MASNSAARDEAVASTSDVVKSTLEQQEMLPSDSERFALELEFVQCLASPAYLHFLSTSGTFQDPDFLEFLQYLQYWKKATYARFLSYPHCLHFLDLLIKKDGGEAFRRELSSVAFRNFCHEQQFYSWQYRSKRLYGRGLKREIVADEEALGNKVDQPTDTNSAGADSEESTATETAEE